MTHVLKSRRHKGKKREGIRAILLILGIVCIGWRDGHAQAAFVLTSGDLHNRLSLAQVYAGYGCTGQNISPALQWAYAPTKTRSFAVTVFDPDAPTGKGWWHWLMFNIPLAVSALRTDAGNVFRALAPHGSIQSVTNFGTQGYGGACPPKGDPPHRYLFTVYALDIAHLDLDPKTPPSEVAGYIKQHTIARASITAYYQR